MKSPERRLVLLGMRLVTPLCVNDVLVRLAALACAGFLAVACGGSDTTVMPPAPDAGVATDGTTVQPNAVIYRAGVAPIPYFSNDNALDKAASLRVAFADAKAGDLIEVGAGRYDFGHVQGNVVFPTGVVIRGMGKDKTHLFGSVWSDNQGTQFSLQDTAVEDMTLECQTYGPNEDGRTIGFDNMLFGVGPGPFSARISRAKLIGNAWTVYNWNNAGNHLLIEDSEIVSGRIGVAAMGSESASQFFDIVRCTFTEDASLSNDIGATSNQNYAGVFGVIARGGLIRVIDCEMSLKDRPRALQDTSSSWTPRVCGVTDTFEAGPSQGTQVVVSNLHISLDTTGADPSRCWDIDIEEPLVRPNVQIVGGVGSAADGGLSTNY
jgi:hypothetical protein